jgi:hypothetical protein
VDGAQLKRPWVGRPSGATPPIPVTVNVVTLTPSGNYAAIATIASIPGTAAD